ncbi:MAG: tRNA uridine-5-carboxymethylaminomethyl(34) synthesis GTPase MnmE [Deltaproteobacteria bacterium]|nr:tRNA uridine-5-carboxymethylaminomethyl(34) synthesis GTPase MnmE [Deltaproteobacteria bacterium]
MLLNGEKDTITAIATPYGESGIGIVRISGPLAEKVATRLFRPKKKPARLKSHHLYYGEILDPGNGKPLDEVLLTLMRKPKTYTKEDIVEINCHGGYLVLKRVLEVVLEQGVRLAQPGEFTKRAFLNGRIDLSQAEAVIDLIGAKTAKGLRMANQQLKGNLSHEIEGLREAMVRSLALVEALIDFPDEDIEVDEDAIRRGLEEGQRRVSNLIQSYEEGRIYRNGVSVSIAGKTNVGKSSLLNILLRENRAIVTPIPGTTRDVIEEVLNIHEIPIRLVDMAGIRRASGLIEKEGVRLAKDRVAEADAVILVIDGSRRLDKDDWEIIDEVKEKKKVVAVNKKDLPMKTPAEQVQAFLHDTKVVEISALKNWGIDTLKDSLYSTLTGDGVGRDMGEAVIVNARHKRALEGSLECLRRAEEGMEGGIPIELVALELRSCLDHLGEIRGETTTEEVLERIFSQFCIGK